MRLNFARLNTNTARQVRWARLNAASGAGGPSFFAECEEITVDATCCANMILDVNEAFDTDASSNWRSGSSYNTVKRRPSVTTYINGDQLSAIQEAYPIDAQQDVETSSASDKKYYLDLSDSSDTDSASAGIERSAFFDESSTAFESLLEENDAQDDSFNSDDDDAAVVVGESNEMSSRTSTLRAGESCRDCAENSCDADTRQCRVGVVVCGSCTECAFVGVDLDPSAAFVRTVVDSFWESPLKVSYLSNEMSANSAPRRCSAGDRNAAAVGGSLVRFSDGGVLVRIRGQSHNTSSPIWKRKSVHSIGSAGSLASSSSSSEVSCRLSGLSGNDSLGIVASASNVSIGLYFIF